jgi:chromosome segregation ATPase
MAAAHSSARARASAWASAALAMPLGEALSAEAASGHAGLPVESHISEMIRVHELWNESKRAVLEEQRQHARTRTQLEAEMRRREDAFFREAEALRAQLQAAHAELQVRTQQLSALEQGAAHVAGVSAELQQRLEQSDAALHQEAQRADALDARLREAARESEALRRRAAAAEAAAELPARLQGELERKEQLLRMQDEELQRRAQENATLRERVEALAIQLREVELRALRPPLGGEAKEAAGVATGEAKTRPATAGGDADGENGRSSGLGAR